MRIGLLHVDRVLSLLSPFSLPNEFGVLPGLNRFFPFFLSFRVRIEQYFYLGEDIRGPFVKFPSFTTQL